MSSSSSYTASNLPSPPTTPPQHRSVPYIAGSRFVARRHELPPPCGRNYNKNRALAPCVVTEKSQLDWCLAHPPKVGTTLWKDTRTIQFHEAIRTGNDCGAQVLVTHDQLVAKIYDPVYYNFNLDIVTNRKRNVSASAEKDYIVESAAYLELSTVCFQGTIMPKYFGSWTIDVPVLIDGKTQLREVRLILIEYVAGTRMHDINLQDLTQDEKENVMRKVIEAEMDLRFAGLEHSDFEPRNIILAQNTSFSTSGDETALVVPLEDPNLPVCVIDFALSGLLRLVNGGLMRRDYYNPLFIWMGQKSWSDYGWLPPSEEARDWMWRMRGQWWEGRKVCPSGKRFKQRIG